MPTGPLASVSDAVPFHDHDITDATKRAAVVESYQAVLAGTDPPESLVDPRDVLTAETEAELGHRPRAGASAEEILHSVGQRCHNDDLEQTVDVAQGQVKEIGPLKLKVLKGQITLDLATTDATVTLIRTDGKKIEKKLPASIWKSPPNRARA